MPTKPSSTSRLKLLGVLCAAAIGLAACGSDGAPISAPVEAATEQAEATPSTAAASPAATPAAVTSASSPLGDILVGSNGLALYGFTNDADATSACYGTCADAWPPVIVDADWDVAPGLDSGIFNAFARDDGQLQLVAGKWPLYFFAGDAIPTDLNGQGSGDVWFAVGTDGKLITDVASGDDQAQAADGQEEAQAAAAQAIVAVGATEAGDVLVDEGGLSLYGFLDDDQGLPTCEGACADAWPPLFVDSAELPAGLDSNVFSVAERSDGTFQLKAGKWPLYLFAGDGAPGDINGQGSGEVWFLAAPDGGLVKGDAQAASESDSDGY
ncbi:MAG: hypothetical protein ACRBK7_11480 [Acidimicrobiales bacterium]